MNVIEYKNFFNAVTRAFAELPDFYATFIRHGFEPQGWPECEGKGVAIEFDRLVRDKGIDYAQLHVARRVSHLNDYPLRHDTNGLICEFEEFKKYGLYRELGQALLSDPLRGNEALAGFKSKNKTGVVVENFKEKILDHVQERIRLGETKTETDTIINDWVKLSKLVGGFNPGRVILLVAGTGVGKTTLALNIILSATKTVPVLCFNMEMFLTDIYDRLCMMGAGITTRDWKHLDRKETVDKAAGFISAVVNRNDLLVTDGRTLTIEQITNQMHQSKDSHGVKIVFVDYDQKIRTRYQGEEWQTLQRAIEDLEEVAKETKTCVVVLAQGDENHLPKASKRSMQSASAVLAFQVEDGVYFIETRKNRFGRNRVKLEVKANFEQYTVTEGEEIISEPINENKFMTKESFSVAKNKTPQRARRDFE